MKKYMHSITKGQRNSVITEIERRLVLAKIRDQVRVEAVSDKNLKNEFYIELDSDILATDVQQILKLICKERNWSIQGWLFDGRISRPPIVLPIEPRKILIPIRDYQILEKVIILLSNHRLPIDPARPLSLAKRQILSILVSSLSPEYPENRLLQELETTLRELEAKGEIYAGMGNRFCIAQPTVLYEEQLFCGDRAYLPVAHQLLGNAATDSTSLNFGEVTFDVLKDKLASRGISLIKIEQSLQHLLESCCPSAYMLRGYEIEDPFLNPDYDGILHYAPRIAEQSDRWLEPSRANLRNPDLLKLPTGEYLWHEQGVFYQIDKDTAVLAMFQLDSEVGQPINVVWDCDLGILDLRNLTLPSSYAQQLWRISSPEQQGNRVRYFQPNYRKQVVQIFQRLGCRLL
jgi:hypothetical protein